MQARNDDRKTVETLVRQAQQNHQPAFTSLYELYYAQIFRYVSFKCGSTTEAEDITGEVFLKMIESIHSFRWKGYPFTSWLYRIAHNLVAIWHRDTQRRPTVALDTQISADTADAQPDKVTESNEQTNILQRVLRCLNMFLVKITKC